MSEMFVDFNEDYNGDCAVRVRGEHPLPRMVMHELSDKHVVDSDYEYTGKQIEMTCIGKRYPYGELTYDSFVDVVSEIVAKFLEDKYFDVSINPI